MWSTKINVGYGLLICIGVTLAQLPPRIQIPGAIQAQPRPAPFRPQRIIQDAPPLVPRLRRPIPNAIPVPIREIRPVVEEVEEPNLPTSSFDEEVNKLSIPSVNTNQREPEIEEENIPRPTPLPFRPERPIPVSRENIRERPFPPRPELPLARPLPVLRQEVARPIPRPVIREENLPVPVRQPVRQARPPLPPVPQERPQPIRAPQRQQQNDDEEERNRKKKPQAQILRKYRTDNADGSITWGYENDDGTWKEETLGVDCITRGKYGYYDPDGVKREFSYESGNKCDAVEEEEEEAAPQTPALQSRKNYPQQFKS